MARRSWIENSGFLLECTPIATISRSQRPTACLTTSRWPLVTGSNEPGYSAMRGINPIYLGPGCPASRAHSRLWGKGHPLILNRFAARGVSQAKPIMFRPLTGDETKLRRNETILGLREDSRKRGLGSNERG